MKPVSLFIIFCCCCFIAFAHHNKGGTIWYKYLGPGSADNTSKYEVTVQHYVLCQGIDDEYEQVYLGIFDGATNVLLQTIKIPRSNIALIQKTTFNACINQTPEICFFSPNYITIIEVSNNIAGYILSEQECCRTDATTNVIDPGTVGFTNTTTIPGVINGMVYRNNSSPDLIIRDTAVICHNSYFKIDFSATDPDGDQLTYNFCGAKSTGSSARQPIPPSAPPYTDVPYTPGYNATAPLGSGVTINSTTGLISGIAPADTGQYIIAVCINEFRHGVLINTTKKEFLVTVADCTLTTPALESYTNCNNYSFTFKNASPSSNITSYLWDFGVANTDKDTTHATSPSFTYTDTGTYTLKLVITGSAGCLDSTTSTVKVYPGLSADFSFNSNCHTSPIGFADASSFNNGIVTNWLWNFGDETSANNTSTAKDASHQYTAPGIKTVTLIVQTDKGCSDTVTKSLEINEKPIIKLPFTDTLICAGDKLPVTVKSSAADFKWAPLYNIDDVSTANPVVYPNDTTTYTVIATDKSCIDSASIKVNVLHSITVSLPADTAICATDSIILSPISNALSYSWSERDNGSSLSEYNIKYPHAAPLQTTNYHVTASLGHCQDNAHITVYVSPYPTVSVSGDTSICYGSTATIKGNTNAVYYNWLPANGLIHANSLQPVAKPSSTTSYVLTVKDTFYCQKSVSDTVRITVIPSVQVNAGHDTSIVIGQPMQLLATSNNTTAAYQWKPAIYLSNADIYNPVATISNTTIDSITYYVKAITPEGCTGEDNIKIMLYKTLPDIFIPTAFTPNGDGLNDVFKPITAGIAQMYYFRVYNRSGQIVFQTTGQGQGWNGTFRGILQPSGTYVFSVAGKDYLGKIIEKKGTVTLIR